MISDFITSGAKSNSSKFESSKSPLKFVSKQSQHIFISWYKRKDPLVFIHGSNRRTSFQILFTEITTSTALKKRENKGCRIAAFSPFRKPAQEYFLENNF